ncbi:hypothetical protein ME7_00520 [Bartonella birtlesii LL-WM9]|uniref:Uncharacterized protein n=1 Tax=Bartonella birtlesii LL-WM9 TaxID=1094552 RepID=J1J1M8_9HYPH|nr:hypothetical protein [Bartonella birtlesii]EJF77505.1 hypothetical protein ME7_00520 [Bartonella birtlesii LL-WM9]
MFSYQVKAEEKMVNLNGVHQRKLKYWLICIVGFFAILFIVFVGGFYMAKPYLNSFVKREIARHSIKAETYDVSIMGKVNLTNVTLPVPAGVSLKIGALSARPPISFIPGTFTFYNVDLQYKNINVKVPQISFNSISLKEKDSTLTSHLLQSIMRIDLSSIVAPDIQLSVKNADEQIEKLKIENFQLFNFKKGQIGSVSIKNMDLTATVADGTKQMRLTAKSDAIEAHDMDINYAYAILLGKGSSVNQVKNITGPISLKNLMVDIFEEKEKEKDVSLAVGAFKTSGFKMRSFKQTPQKLFDAYLNAREKNNIVAEKKVIRDILINDFSNITLADADVSKLVIDAPQFKETFESFQFKQGLWNQPIPKKLLISFNNLSILTKKMNEKDLDLLKKLNLERFDFSGKLDVSYDEKKRMLFLNTMSFNIRNVGSGEISAQVVDVDEKLFSAQKDLMIAASQNIGIFDIGIRYTDAGFIDKLFSYLAQNLNDKKHDLKQELYDNFYLMMTQSPKLLLKKHDEAEKISKSLGDFAKRPQTLTIKIKAKDDKGLTITDLQSALQNDLSTILNKVHLVVKNQASP